ncbi:MAG: protein kinase [Myxococcota bacterium]
MGAVKAVFKFCFALVGLALLLAGGLGLAVAYAPDTPGLDAATDVFTGLLGPMLAALSLGWSASEVMDALVAVPLRYVVGPLGLVLLIGAMLPGKKKVVEFDEEEGSQQPDKRALKKARKEAKKIAKRGMPEEAGELCFAVGLMDDAAVFFEQAGDLQRAAEIRHDQNRFLDSAELYSKAGQHESAGAIYAQQEAWEKAAEAYTAAENLSVAAEMYEKAGADRKAAECFEKCDFPRHAAKAYIRCEDWLAAARCLEQVMAEEGTGHVNDPKKAAEYAKLVRMTGNLYERAGQFDRAQAVLAKGGASIPAAELAEKGEDWERAGELYLEGKDAERAAAAFEKAGEADRAARILAEYYRDRGESEEAALQFEKAGELLEAGDLYRSIEKFSEAGACYERFGDGAQAAEMFSLAGDRQRAAANYEKAGHYSEAAELYALAGDAEREAELLEQAGDCLKAGQIHLEAGRIEEAIGALQKVTAEEQNFSAAAALLGKIFREREQYSLAIAKLTDAVAGREIDRESLDAFFCLATVHEASENWNEAHELYEKILAFDYHYEDTAARLEATRAKLTLQSETQGPVSGGGGPTGTSGRYIIRGTLGRGGMGIVYKAEDTVLDRVVAFKVLPESLKENPQALKNFLREAKHAAQLNHPNIVTVYDAGEQDGVYYIAMEYVDGNTLKDIIKHRGKIAPRGIVHVVSQMAEALAYAHEKKIVHRDVKTANTMWTKDRKAKIMDFGLAKVIEEVRNHTTVISGTPYYMSPEQTLGKNVDHRSDLYSLGVSVFEMATGELPFTEGNLPYHHVHTPAPSVREIDAEVPDGIAKVVEKCLRKDPAERYQSAREILTDLRQLSEGSAG